MYEPHNDDICKRFFIESCKSMCIVFKPSCFNLYGPIVSIGKETMTYVNTVEYLGFVSFKLMVFLKIVFNLYGEML